MRYRLPGSYGLNRSGLLASFKADSFNSGFGLSGCFCPGTLPKTCLSMYSGGVTMSNKQHVFRTSLDLGRLGSYWLLLGSEKILG